MAIQRDPRAAEEEMEPSIWSQLPEELLERTVAMLPLRDILNLRSTCKRFHHFLLSPPFLSLHSATTNAAAAAFLILSHPQFYSHSLPLYSYPTDSWRTTTLPPSSAATLSSSSSGLLLFSLPHSSSLLVSNPLTASSRLLPSPTHFPPSSPSSAAGATLVSLPSPRPHGYKIFLPSPSSNWVFLYDSLSSSWARFPGHASAAIGEGVTFSNSLYFTTLEPFTLLGFNLATGQWDPNPAPALPGGLAFIRLVGGGERLFLVGGVGNNGISRSLWVWELVDSDGGGRRWEEVWQLPEIMHRKFVSVCFHNYAHVYCIWHEGLLCICCTTWPEVLFLKVARKTWHWLPRCPLLQEKWSCGFRWFSFVPDLYALV